MWSIVIECRKQIYWIVFQFKRACKQFTTNEEKFSQTQNKKLRLLHARAFHNALTTFHSFMPYLANIFNIKKAYFICQTFIARFSTTYDVIIIISRKEKLFARVKMFHRLVASGSFTKKVLHSATKQQQRKIYSEFIKIYGRWRHFGSGVIFLHSWFINFLIPSLSRWFLILCFRITLHSTDDSFM